MCVKKIHQFLSSTKKDAHKRKLVPFFCLTMWAFVIVSEHITVRDIFSLHMWICIDRPSLCHCWYVICYTDINFVKGLKLTFLGVKNYNYVITEIKWSENKITKMVAFCRLQLYEFKWRLTKTKLIFLPKSLPILVHWKYIQQICLSIFELCIGCRLLSLVALY